MPQSLVRSRSGRSSTAGYEPNRSADSERAKEDGGVDDRRLFRTTTLGSLKEQHLLLHHRVVFEHAERTVGTGPDHRPEVAGHGHGDETDSDGARLGCAREWMSVRVVH